MTLKEVEKQNGDPLIPLEDQDAEAWRACALHHYHMSMWQFERAIENIKSIGCNCEDMAIASAGTSSGCLRCKILKDYGACL